MSGSWIRDTTRAALYHRDGFRCMYCGAKAAPNDRHGKVVLTLDHLLARDLGGSNHPTNLVTACKSCNSSKQELTIYSWFRKLRARGVNTDMVGPRIRRQVRRPLDRKQGRWYAAQPWWKGKFGDVDD